MPRSWGPCCGDISEVVLKPLRGLLGLQTKTSKSPWCFSWDLVLGSSQKTGLPWNVGGAGRSAEGPDGAQTMRSSRKYSVKHLWLCSETWSKAEFKNNSVEEILRQHSVQIVAQLLLVPFSQVYNEDPEQNAE